MRCYTLASADGIDALNLAEQPQPRPGPNEILIRVRASSLNYRDLTTVEDPLPRGVRFPFTPNSDGAGEVIEIGANVSRFRTGDRVCGIFFQRWQDGAITAEHTASALGGALAGMLCEYRVLHEDGVVATPAHLSDAEASTLPCAAVTAWNSLVETARIGAGDTVLLLGTGGVSIFALQLCGILGARAIITSSSDSKLARASALGAWATINYREHPAWDERVLELTDGRGVDHTVEVGGAGTLERSINATRIAGSIGLIGILTGGHIDPMPILRKSLRVQGVYVGSRRMFEDMNRAIAHHELRPVIDRTYGFEEARQAFHDMRGQTHFGKLVISI